MQLVFQITALVFAVVLHEVAHGWAAYRLGDPSAMRAHRLTLNPLAHIDVMGSVVLPLFLIMMGSPVLFGWAKPVPVNPAFFRDRRRGMMLVGAAGPATNLALAALSGALFRFFMGADFVLFMLAGSFLRKFLAYFCITNVMLGLFNLVPIPPLDGSRVLLGVLPRDLAAEYIKLEPFGFLIIFMLMWLGALQRIIAPAALFLFRLLLDV